MCFCNLGWRFTYERVKSNLVLVFLFKHNSVFQVNTSTVNLKSIGEARMNFAQQGYKQPWSRVRFEINFTKSMKTFTVLLPQTFIFVEKKVIFTYLEKQLAASPVHHQEKFWLQDLL